jgi:hypothetical protein
MTLNTQFKNEIRSAVKDEFDDKFLFLAVGSGNTPETEGDTILDTETYRVARLEFDKTTFPQDVLITGEVGFNFNNGNDIEEFGWSAEGTTDGVLKQRKVLNSPIAKVSDISVVITNKYRITVTQS